MRRLVTVALLVSACATPPPPAPPTRAQIAAIFRGERKPKAPLVEHGRRSDIDVEGVFAIVEKHKESVRGCVEEGAKSGTVPVGRQVLILGIRPNGRVARARFAH